MLEISGIYKSYHRQNILAGADLTVAPGECVGIVGYNGCGKTTLLSILAGAQKADRGSILYNGREASGHPRVFAEEAAYVPQENPLMEELTVRDNLLLWYRGSRKQMESDLKDGAASMLGVDRMLDRTAGKLSGGMKKPTMLLFLLWMSRGLPWIWSVRKLSGIISGNIWLRAGLLY